MNNQEELNFLKDRLLFRQKMFVEWAFVDNKIIQDIKKFMQEMRDIEEEICKLKE